MDPVFDSLEWPAQTWCRANILIDEGGSATGSDGTSASLTVGRDRSLLRQIRQYADLVITGGETVRREGWFLPPYGSLLVLSKRGILPLETCEHPERVIVCSCFDEALSAMRELGATRILCEGGPQLLRLMLSHALIDELFVSVITQELPTKNRDAVEMVRAEFDLADDDFELDQVIEDDGISFTRFRHRRVTDLS